MTKTACRFALAAVAVCSAFAAETRFEISYPAGVNKGPITGRVFIMISRSNDREPRLQISRIGVPFFGRDIERLLPGQSAVIDATDLGTPVESLREIPPGTYYVQAFINVYSEFRRSDGNVLWMHDDQWEGQHWNRSPGNLYSAPKQVTLDAAAGYRVPLVCDQVIPPVEVPPDTEWVKRFKMQSQILTKFWGRPVYLGATVLLPRDYAKSTEKYPALYEQGHFGLGAPLGFSTGPGQGRGGRGGQELYNEWMKDNFPRMIVVTLQHPNPYFDDSYAVNSVNVGPYGDAIHQELIPEIEKRFRVIRQPWARVLSGGSTGGWEALALQVFYPDFYGGTWSYCPDSVDFSDVEGIDVYKDTNAFYKTIDWRREPTINSREINGQVRSTSEQRNHFELVNGTHGRSGEQLDIWSAVFGPLGKDGYFEPLFDKRTGAMHPEVAQYWKEHYDIRYHLEKNWYTLGPKLVDQIHVFVGDADNFFLNNGVHLLQDWMKTTKDPHYEGYFVYGAMRGHCYSGPENSAERLKEMAQHILSRMPAGTVAGWWKN
ncbi:MAG TPA: alpha/beta hydrolase-fold protein [Bryobacteraceae bacterium]|nr:alpha/beta hydrolase-fold protein [Bryobacteraceae bacterium]